MFPWTATALSTTDIRIHGIHIDIRFETTPTSMVACPLNGVGLALTGTLGLGIGTQTVYDPLGRRVTFNNTTGLTADLGAGGGPGATITGFLATTVTLNIAD
jgi:hypothetical protein